MPRPSWGRPRSCCAPRSPAVGLLRTVSSARPPVTTALPGAVPAGAPKPAAKAVTSLVLAPSVVPPGYAVLGLAAGLATSGAAPSSAAPATPRRRGAAAAAAAAAPTTTTAPTTQHCQQHGLSFHLFARADKGIARRSSGARGPVARGARARPASAHELALTSRMSELPAARFDDAVVSSAGAADAEEALMAAILSPSQRERSQQPFTSGAVKKQQRRQALLGAALLSAAGVAQEPSGSSNSKRSRGAQPGTSSNSNNNGNSNDDKGDGSAGLSDCAVGFRRRRVLEPVYQELDAGAGRRARVRRHRRARASCAPRSALADPVAGWPTWWCRPGWHCRSATRWRLRWSA
jgi:hypothetical protein